MQSWLRYARLDIETLSAVLIGISVVYILLYMRLLFVIAVFSQWNGCMKLFLIILMFLFGIFHIAGILSSINNIWARIGIMSGLTIIAHMLYKIILRYNIQGEIDGLGSSR